MRSTRLTTKSILFTFAITTVLAYGLLLPLMGFYWDDWPFAWIAKFLGPKEFFPAFAGVRPFLAPIFFVTTSLIPLNPVYWQIFALVSRLISGLSAWFALNGIWPQHQRQVYIASLLFLIFPGYSQHWVALTHINQEWIPFIFYLWSFGFSARALRHKNAIDGNTAKQTHRRDTIYALLLLVAGVFPTEYFIGLEPLRFLFIWVIVSEEVTGFSQRLIQTLKHWAPYLLIWLANAAWLAYFYTVGTYQSYDVEVVRAPLTVQYLFSVIIEAVWKAGLYIWGQVVVLAAKTITAPTTLATVGLIAISFIFFFVYVSKLDQHQSQTKRFATSALLVGLVGILLGRLPSVAAGLPLTLQSSYDRFMISMMLAGSLFVTGLVELLIKNARARNFVFALLIALGIGQQFFNANIFRRDWAKQQEIYWQLAWRIPAMEPGTVLLTDQMPIDYETDLSFTAPINWMYAPDYTRSDLPYAMLYVEKRLGRAALPSLEKNTEIELSFRTVDFRGSTSQAIVIHMPKNGCLRVLDPARADGTTYSDQSHFLVDAIVLSDLAFINVEANETAKLPFVSEPDHTWCYYYAKAELARQKGDWNQVSSLINEAISLGYQPEDRFEWLTYIEAQAMLGDMNTAEKLSNKILAEDKDIRAGLCELWKRIQLQVDEGSESGTRASQLLSDFRCAR